MAPTDGTHSWSDYCGKERYPDLFRELNPVLRYADRDLLTHTCMHTYIHTYRHDFLQKCCPLKELNTKITKIGCVISDL